MRSAQVSASLSRCAGGIFEIELALAHHLSRLGVEVQALGLEDVHFQKDSQRWAPIPAEAVKTTGPRAFGYSHQLLPRLHWAAADLAHLHTLWMYPSVATHRWGRQSRRPYLVTPNGMLEPWALKNSEWKKRLAGMLYENRCLRGAACLQANTQKELADFKAYGLTNPVCVIPNGVDLPEIEDPRSGNQQTTPDTGPRILLFLGRLHPKKGLVNALRAWNEIRKQEAGSGRQKAWQFIIAGWDQGGHEADLKRLCDELGLAFTETPVASFLTKNRELKTENSGIVFAGPAFGVEKDQLLRQASAFILPSFSEGLPMSVLEAWAYHLPVLMTRHCNLPEGFASGAAIRIGTNVPGIADGLRALQQASARDLLVMGNKGRDLVESRFTWPQVAAQMKEVYEWVLGGGPKPGCVA